MSFIKQIKIRNFRSILSVNPPIKPKALNIFVGNNDAGKSNVLRALNLFFNDRTDLETPFRFEQDYSYHAAAGKGKAREIKIELLISPPSKRFKGAKDIKWTKVWRQGKPGMFDETFVFADGTSMSRKSNIENWARSLEYHYVPAVKGKTYFSHLMGELHDVLSYAHSEKFEEQGDAFITGIQEITEQIKEELLRSINIGNAIQVPSDFKVLFSSLDFGTQVNDKMYYLNLRGDGIKCRHIPIILKYIASQKKDLAIPGKIKPDAIWGFEEPENNLELSHAFQQAAEFLEFSKTIQIFLTTHSPAFYSLEKSENDTVETYFVRSEINGESEIRNSKSTSVNIDLELGMLPIITPYLEQIADGQHEIDLLKDKLSDLPEDVSCLVLTEDQNFGYLECMLESSGFNLNGLQIESYHGAGNFDRALGVADYTLKKGFAENVVIYRDRDGLRNAEVRNLRRKAARIGAKLFVPETMDIEGLFVNIDHIQSVHPELEPEMIEQSLNKAKEDCLVESLSRYLGDSKESDRTRRIRDFYAEAAGSFYGKMVLSKLKEILSEDLPEIDLCRPTAQLGQQELSEIAIEIWGED